MAKTDIFTAKILTLSGMMVLTGTLNTLAFKFQNQYNYKHGLTMTVQMFLGEYLNIIILVFPLMLATKKLEKHLHGIQRLADENNKTTQVKWIHMAFGGFLDAFGSGLQTVGLFLVSPSVYQMMKNGAIIFTAIFTITYLKKPLYRHNWLGVGVLMVGFIVVGLSSVIFGNNGEGEKKSLFLSLLGVILMLLSLVFQGFQYVYEERVMDQVEVDPKRFIAAEGVMGTITMTLLLFITANIPCYSKDICGDNESLDSPAVGMIEIFQNFGLLFYTLLSIFSIMVFNLTGLYLTKYVSSIFRVIIDSIRTISVWFFAVFLKFEELKLGSFILQVIGFSLLILGNLIYNEIIVIRFLGFDKHLGEKKPNRDPEQLEEEIQEVM